MLSSTLSLPLLLLPLPNQAKRPTVHAGLPSIAGHRHRPRRLSRSYPAELTLLDFRLEPSAASPAASHRRRHRSPADCHVRLLPLSGRGWLGFWGVKELGRQRGSGERGRRVREVESRENPPFLFVFIFLFPLF